MPVVSRQFHLANRPDGLPGPDSFHLVERELDAPGKGQLLVRNQWISVPDQSGGKKLLHDGPGGLRDGTRGGGRIVRHCGLLVAWADPLRARPRA